MSADTARQKEDSVLVSLRNLRQVEAQRIQHEHDLEQEHAEASRRAQAAAEKAAREEGERQAREQAEQRERERREDEQREQRRREQEQREQERIRRARVEAELALERERMAMRFASPGDNRPWRARLTAALAVLSSAAALCAAAAWRQAAGAEKRSREELVRLGRAGMQQRQDLALVHKELSGMKLAIAQGTLALSETKKQLASLTASWARPGAHKAAPRPQRLDARTPALFKIPICQDPDDPLGCLPPQHGKNGKKGAL